MSEKKKSLFHFCFLSSLLLSVRSIITVLCSFESSHSCCTYVGLLRRKIASYFFTWFSFLSFRCLRLLLFHPPILRSRNATQDDEGGKLLPQSCLQRKCLFQGKPDKLRRSYRINQKTKLTMSQSTVLLWRNRNK